MTDNSFLAARYPEYRDRAARLPAPVTGDGTLSSAWAEILGYSQPTNVAVTDDTVRGLPALDRAKGLVVSSVAAMLTAATVADRDGTAVVKPAVIERPHPLLGAYEFYEQVVDSVVMHGNYVAVVVGYDPDDMQLVPVPLGAVSVDASSGLPLYTINKRVYTWREVFHVRANAPTGTWWGRGVVEKFRNRALSEQLHSQAYGENSFRTGAVPTIDVKLDIDLPTGEQVTDVKAGFVDRFGGGSREPIVHGRAMTVTPLSWSPHDAQFIESRQVSFAEAALMVGLRPEDIGASLGSGSSLSYGNRTDDALQRITDGYQPWMERVEQPLSDLIGDGHEVSGDPEALLRLSTRERLELRQLKQELGVETPAESRAEEGREPLPTDEPKDDSQ